MSITNPWTSVSLDPSIAEAVRQKHALITARKQREQQQSQHVQAINTEVRAAEAEASKQRLATKTSPVCIPRVVQIGGRSVPVHIRP